MPPQPPPKRLLFLPPLTKNPNPLHQPGCVTQVPRVTFLLTQVISST